MNQTIMKSLFFLSLTSMAFWQGFVSAECNSSVNLEEVSFKDLGDGSVQDSRTGLIWAKCSLGQDWNAQTQACEASNSLASTFTWQDALQQSAHYSLGSSNRIWRLPNKKELASIVDFSCSDPAINAQVFPNTFNSNYWSSTALPYSSPLSVAVIHFQKGDFNSARAGSELASVRFVADPK